MQVPFLNLAAQHTRLKSELLPVVEQVLSMGNYVLGPNVTAFEQELAAYLGVAHAVGVNSGSDALTLALRALDIRPGDEVITTPFTYIAPAEAIYQNGAQIVFADIDEQTFNIAPAEIARRITPRTKAIVPVHLFGQAAAMAELKSLVEKRQISIVEDCAQAIGARYADQPLGAFGTIGCFSFYPTKNLGADGDGGMIVTRDNALARKLRMLRAHGIEKRYHHDLHGYNSRLDELQAAILRVKLRRLDGWNKRRREIAARYDAGLKALPVKTPVQSPNNFHVFHVYAILTQQRDDLVEFLGDHGIPVIVYYPLPLHLQKVYSDLGHKPGDFPRAEAVARQILPLPMYPELMDEQVEYVIQTVRQFFT